jgi:hypothetical protein
MRVRRWLPSFAPVAILAVLCSCSSDSGSNGTAGQAGSTSQPDAALDAEPDVSEDAPSEAPPEEAAAPLCPPGSWGNVDNTQCDLIEQDCENKLLTCYPNENGTSCTPLGYGAKSRGMACEANAECASGLACLAKYCTPFCCEEFQYEICGPGGRCAINLTVDATHTVTICSYAEPCTLFAGDCPSDEGCQPVADDGSSACSTPSSGAFVGEGNNCEARNDCGDAQACANQGGVLPICRFYCLLDDSPYGAGTIDGAPGQGGCPQGQTCKASSGNPDWLGICSTS